MTRNVEAFWDRAASYYDNLYWDGYSDKENETVGRDLHALFNKGTVLDVGCGLGLAGRLLPDTVTVHGCDISPEMLRKLRAQPHRYASLLTSSAERLDRYPSQEFDGLLATFGVFSYVSYPTAAVKEFARVLKPGGKIYVMGLQRRALWRLLRGQTKQRGTYGTRGYNQASPPVTFYTPALLHRFFDPYFTIDVQPMSWFGKVAEVATLWPVDRLLCRTFPALAHSFRVIGTLNA